MLSKLLISVIIPAYNSGKTLRACLQSIIKQSFTYYEVCIIDNLSADDTLDIVREYSDKYPYINYVSEKDKGPYDAMNKGILIAKGDYLYFLGSDDTLYDDDVLVNVATFIDKTPGHIIYGNVIMNGSNKWVSNGLKHAGEFDLKRMLSENICHQSIFYSSRVFKELGNYNLKYRVFADYDFNLRCFARYRFTYTDIIIANFKVGGISTLITDDYFETDKTKNIIKYFFKYLFSKPFIDSRFYVQQAAFSKKSHVNLAVRLYCILAYFKLKTHSFLV